MLSLRIRCWFRKWKTNTSCCFICTLGSAHFVSGVFICQVLCVLNVQVRLCVWIIIINVVLEKRRKKSTSNSFNSSKYDCKSLASCFILSLSYSLCVCDCSVVSSVVVDVFARAMSTNLFRQKSRPSIHQLLRICLWTSTWRYLYQSFRQRFCAHLSLSLFSLSFHSFSQFFQFSYLFEKWVVEAVGIGLFWWGRMRRRIDPDRVRR